MNVLLLFFAIITGFFLCYRTNDNEFFFAFSEFLVIISVLVYVITELLSVINEVKISSLSIFWGAFLIFELLILFRKKRKIYLRVSEIFTRKNIILWAIPFSFFLFSICIAIITVPYNWDSLVYHLARIAFWEENGSIGHYATNVIRQVSSPVLAEIFNMHIYIMSGHFLPLLNLLQCFSYIYISISLYVICRLLEVKKCFSILAVIVFCTMPIAIAESVTTQNDLCAGVWVVIFVAEIVNYMVSGKKMEKNYATLRFVLILAALLSLEYLTKPSGIFAMLVFLLGFLVVLLWQKDNIKYMIMYSCVAIAEILLLVLPEIIRNIITFNSINDASQSSNILVGSLGKRILFINFLKNFTYNLPTRLSPYVEKFLNHFMEFISGVLKVDINARDINMYADYAYVSPYEYSHDLAINPLPVWLFIVGIAVFIAYVFIRKRSFRFFRMYAIISSGCSFVIFCTVLRWQPWGTRLMLPYCALLCCVIGVIIDELFFRVENETLIASKWIVVGVVLVMAISGGINSIVYQFKHAINYSYRDGVVRAMLHDDDLYNGDKMIIDRIIEDGYKNVGIYRIAGQYNFTWFVGLEDKVDKIYHVGVDNVTKKYMDTTLPDCIIGEVELLDTNSISINGVEYSLELKVSDNMYLLKRD